MKALAKLKKQPGIWIINDAPIPEYGYNDVLIKIKKRLFVVLIYIFIIGINGRKTPFQFQ